MRYEMAVRRLETGDGRWEMGDGRWEMGEIVTLPMSCSWARILICSSRISTESRSIPK